MADRSKSKTLAIVPARSGSKRIPKKNIKEFFGKPMIAYSIERAQESGLFDHILVSTDSEEMAEVAKKYKAEVPFLRPPALADDFTPLADVVLQALEQAEKELKVKFDSVCCILATAPFIRAEDLKKGFELLQSSGATTVVPVTSFPYPIFRALNLQKDGSFKMFWPEHELSRSNDLPEGFHDVGQFYWLSVEKFKKSKRIFNSDSRVIQIPRYLVQDIDTLEDWDRAEKLYAALHSSADFRRDSQP